MTGKARTWTGVTLLIVLAFNYAVVGVPLYRKSMSIKEKYRATLIKQAKSAEPFRSAEDDYMLEIFRKEKSSIDRKFLILNCVAISLLIVIGSWTVFGLFVHRK